jgi:ribosome-associated toxin RatA of RatAB toxin-antitoxin module
MGNIVNEISINAPIEKIWSILTDLALLDQYDPTVKKSTLISNDRTGLGAKRRVTMFDGKNWFEEKVTVFEINKALTYQLTDCSFPIKGLKHSYSFEKTGNEIKVRQVMEYTVKFGLLGKVLDSLMIRKQSDTGIKKFFAGLKQFAEKN